MGVSIAETPLDRLAEHLNLVWVAAYSDDLSAYKKAKKSRTNYEQTFGDAKAAS